MRTSNEFSDLTSVIALEPEPDRFFVEFMPLFHDAIEQSGAIVSPLSDATRGLVWCSNRNQDALERVVRQHPSIRWVQLPFAGVDPFVSTIRRVNREGLVWTSAKGAYARPVAEHALALTLALLRVFPKRIRAHSWARKPEGISLYGLNVVIVGAGGIALELIRLLQPFDVEITVVRRSSLAVPGARVTVSSDQLHAVLPTADVVVLAAALTDETYSLIGSEELALLKPSACLVNIARGGVIDTQALVDALTVGAFAGAGLDVTDPEPLPDGHPLWSLDNVVITPHQADTPQMVAPLLAERIRVNTAAFHDGGGFVGVVDPEVGY